MDGRPVQPDPLQPARPVVGDEHVGVGEQRPQHLLPALGAQVHGHRSLAAVVQLERRVHLAAVRPRQPAERITTDRLDLDDVGAPVGEDRRARRRGQPQSELDHADACQRATGRRRRSLQFTHRRATVLAGAAPAKSGTGRALRAPTSRRPMSARTAIAWPIAPALPPIRLARRRSRRVLGRRHDRRVGDHASPAAHLIAASCSASEKCFELTGSHPAEQSRDVDHPVDVGDQRDPLPTREVLEPEVLPERPGRHPVPLLERRRRRAARRRPRAPDGWPAAGRRCTVADRGPGLMESLSR